MLMSTICGVLPRYPLYSFIAEILGNFISYLLKYAEVKRFVFLPAVLITDLGVVLRMSVLCLTYRYIEWYREPVFFFIHLCFFFLPTVPTAFFTGRRSGS
jgi:hypothetical protein